MGSRRANIGSYAGFQFSFKPRARAPSLSFQCALRERMSSRDMSGDATSRIETAKATLLSTRSRKVT